MSSGARFFKLAWQLDSRGVSVREQVLVFCSHGVKVRKQVYVRRCGDTFHPPEKRTLYLKVTPFDSKTPTHFHTKVPIGGICVAAKLPNSRTVSLLIIISLSRLNYFTLSLALLFGAMVQDLPCSLVVLSLKHATKSGS